MVRKPQAPFTCTNILETFIAQQASTYVPFYLLQKSCTKFAGRLNNGHGNSCKLLHQNTGNKKGTLFFNIPYHERPMCKTCPWVELLSVDGSCCLRGLCSRYLSTTSVQFRSILPRSIGGTTEAHSRKPMGCLLTHTRFSLLYQCIFFLLFEYVFHQDYEAALATEYWKIIYRLWDRKSSIRNDRWE